MFIPSYRIAFGANREITPPLCLGAALRQPSFAAHRVELRERVNRPDQRAATATQNPNSAFSRIIPMNPEPAAALAPNPKFTFSPINPSASQPPAACFMTRMPTPSRQTYGFTRLPRPSNVLRQQRKRPTGALATAPHPPYFPRIHERGTHP